jgi:hypothetical protein
MNTVANRCFYEDQMIFYQSRNNVTYELENFDDVFYNTYLTQFGGPTAINTTNARWCSPFSAPAPG